jgi:hypothetical protein
MRRSGGPARSCVRTSPPSIVRPAIRRSLPSGSSSRPEPLRLPRRSTDAAAEPLCTYMNARSGADLTSLQALDPTIGLSTGTQWVNHAEQPLVSTDGQRVERSHADTEGHEKGHNRAPLQSIATPASEMPIY